VKATILFAFVSLATVMLTGCSGGNSTVKISGTEILTNTGATVANAPCSGDYGGATFEDLGSGTVVGVTDQNGNAIGTGALRAGSAALANGGECVWKFKVKVPTSATSYSIQVGQRDVVTFNKSDLANNKWAAVLKVDGSGG
jgi:hypothetical protein